MAKAQRRLTDAEFQALRPKLGHLAANRIDAAYRFMVLGQTHQSIADANGWADKSSSVGCARAVWTVLEKHNQDLLDASRSTAVLPRGWSMVQIAAPNHLLEKFVKEVQDYAAGEAVPTSQLHAVRPSSKRRAAG